MKYRIAFFTVDWNYELVESTLHGLKKYVDEHEDVQLCIFDCFGKDVNSPKSGSEYAIFNLAQLDGFDGVLIQGNQIVLGSVREEISRRVQEAGIPAVTVDCPIGGCTLVGIDNRRAQFDIADHVIGAHGARHLVYLTGIMDNGCPEAPQRLDGFLDACRKHGIPQEDIQVVQCTWRASDGIRLAEQWLQEGRAFPDAFVCANDEMALGIIEILEKWGYRIPEDVIITGFDNVTSAELSSPRLSTVARDNEQLNYFAMEVLMEKISGTGKKREELFGHSLICSESCGCGDAALPDYIRNKYFHQTRYLKEFYTFQDQMAEQLFDAMDLPELTAIVEGNEKVFGCGNVYLCINDYYFDNYEKKNWHHDSESFGEEMILTTRGGSSLTPDHQHQYARFPTRDLLPLEIIQNERFWIFYPLHYNTYSIGYLAMNGISEAAKLNLHESIFTFLEIAIENVRKKCLLRQLNNVLDDLYVRDALTGLYNRFGYRRFAPQVYASFLRTDGAAQVLFIDMDDMKGLNDKHGHETGDAAICASADILRRACGERDFIMRYGGDEFLVIASGKETNLREEILSAVERLNRQGISYELSLSVGCVRASREEKRTLNECVQAADAVMYDVKNKRKASRALTPPTPRT